MISCNLMEKLDNKGLRSCLERSRLAARVAEGLGGEKAQTELLRLTGYTPARSKAWPRPDSLPAP